MVCVVMDFYTSFFLCRALCSFQARLRQTRSALTGANPVSAPTIVPLDGDCMIEIRSYPEVLDKINAIVNNGGTAEVKIETQGNNKRIAVVETKRALKILCQFDK